MVDPLVEAVLVRSKAGIVEDKTAEVRSIHHAGSRIVIQYTSGSEPWRYPVERVDVVRHPQPVEIDEDQHVIVDGARWTSVTRLLRFDSREGPWTRIFYRRQNGEAYRTYPSEHVLVSRSAADQPRASEVLSYFRRVVSNLGPDDPFHRVYQQLSFVHPESALARYVTGTANEEIGPAGPLIFPFDANLSQRDALVQGLSHRVSTIDGPPGTGKTQTILNLIANVVASGPSSVGVVSSSNSAVDNVAEGLQRLHLGFVAARLGNADTKKAFFGNLPAVDAKALEGAELPPAADKRLAQLDRQVVRLWKAERRHAEITEEIAAYRLEYAHFQRHLSEESLVRSTDFPLLQQSSNQIISYLAETEVDGSERPGLWVRVRRYLTYGTTRGLDTTDIGVVLALQGAFYERRLAELEMDLRGAATMLRRSRKRNPAQEQQELSRRILTQAIASRLADGRGEVFDEKSYRSGRRFGAFVRRFPVIFSTCHSLLTSLPTGYLLDYLIIDEGSQVSLPAAVVALASCRNLVVVGDRQQLGHIIRPAHGALFPDPPAPAYDVQKHDVLSSVSAVWGPDLPRTTLREHYRCHPAIIGFCNKKFYGGALVPYREASDVGQSMAVVRTSPGNHMRLHTVGGRSNQREIDVILQEILPPQLLRRPRGDIGVTTPYRLQADKLTDALGGVMADTVHAFQGRQKPMIVMTTVIDETWRGQTGLQFVDDPRLVNVAVSRAQDQLVVITNNDMLPRSRHLRDLVQYIAYHYLDDALVESEVVSVFDLLYRAYSPRLDHFASRVHGTSRFRSENIAATMLGELCDEAEFRHLKVVSQVYLRNLLPTTETLGDEERRYVRNGASLDFVCYNRVTNRPVLAVEVDGFAHHENDPRQLTRDRMKNAILGRHGLPVCRLPTTGSRERQRVREALRKAEGPA